MNIHLYFTTNLVFCTFKANFERNFFTSPRLFSRKYCFPLFFLLEEAAYAALIVKDKKS